MIRNLITAWLGTADDRCEELAVALEEAHEDIGRYIGRVATLVAETKALRMIITARDAELAKLRADLAAFMDERFSA